MRHELYALIVHDKDVMEDGQLKKTHKHLVLELVNPIAFTSMQKHFKGAHIEPIKYKKSAYQYLIHNSLTSKEKYQYPLTDIISNNFELVKEIIESEEVETFNESKVLLYYHQGITTQYLFFKHFGIETTKKYWQTYKQLCEEVTMALISIQQGDDLSPQQRELVEDPGGTHGNESEWYYMDLDGVWHRSSGIAPKMPMYRTAEKMREILQMIANEIFRSI